MPIDPPFFALSTQTLSAEEACRLIRRFAAAPAYRSAQVEELEIGAAEYRRALRPEDLEFLQFKRPIRRETVSRLPSLASQRLLFCLNERRMLRWPSRGSSRAVADYRALFTPEMESLSAVIKPYLTAYAFQFLADSAQVEECRRDPEGAVSRLLRQQITRATRIGQHAAEVGFTEEASRFVLTQTWAMLPMQQAALTAAEAAGAFAALPASLQPFPEPDHATAALFTELSHRLDLDLGDHRHWQFYLATSLSRANLLWTFADGADRSFLLWGAAFAAEADFLALACLVGQSADALGVSVAEGSAMARLATPERFMQSLAKARAQYGEEAAEAMLRGFAIGAALAEVAMQDLAEQIEWLSQIDSYRAAAALIEDRIQREDPNIDRDTFIEPRDLCSTTHVHNEHRLVSIETGDMIFWGTPGMRLDLHPGDRILIPYGRLHGSTVTSEECTYHQPIIPDEWVADALRGANHLRLNS